MGNRRSEARLELLLATKKRLNKARCFVDDELSAEHVEVLANLYSALDDAIVAEVDVMTKWARG